MYSTVSRCKYDCIDFPYDIIPRSISVATVALGNRSASVSPPVSSQTTGCDNASIFLKNLYGILHPRGVRLKSKIPGISFYLTCKRNL